MALMAAGNKTTRACRGQRILTRCAFQSGSSTGNVQRRALVGLTAFVPLLIAAPKALALLLDEDDEELVEKAKANRKNKLISQKQVARQYMQDTGMKDRTFESELVPVQKAVYKLAESGVQLESGNLSSVSVSLEEPWVAEFKQAADKFPGAQASAEAVFSQLEILKTLASQSDLKGSKQQFVSLAGAVQTWATDAGVAFKLQGL